MEHLGKLALSVGTEAAEYHRKKYLTKGVFSRHLFVLASAYLKVPKDAEVKVLRVLTIGKKYHLQVRYKDHLYTIPTNKFYKPLIGGKTGVYCEELEDKAISEIDKQIREEMKEFKLLHLDIKIGKKIYQIAGAKKVTKEDATNGKPKADFYFHDSQYNPIYYGSHKAGHWANHFQQYGGVWELDKRKHPVIKEFIRRLKRVITFKDGMSRKPGVRYLMKLNGKNKHHHEVMRHSMFGTNHTSNKYGIENVNGIVHGNMLLMQHEDGTYQLTARKIIHNDITFNAHKHHMEIMARKIEGRSFLGFKNTRVMVIPHNHHRKGIDI